MREILFRGKRKDNGEWVEGFYVCLNSKSHRIYNGCAETDCGDYYPAWFEVIPETVGQYTGLKDKNVVRIFEGDIIKTKHGIRYIVFVDGCFGAAKPNTCLFAELRQYNRELKGKWEVIGNIHDNPELQEEGGE